MADHQQPDTPSSDTLVTSGEPATPDPREQARRILASGQPRESLRRELAALRDEELRQLMHQAAVMNSSPFWREIALRRFIRQKRSG